MPRGTTTLVLGLAIGVVGVMIYNRLRYATVDEDPEVLLDKLSRRMHDLEKKTTAVVETSTV